MVVRHGYPEQSYYYIKCRKVLKAMYHDLVLEEKVEKC